MTMLRIYVTLLLAIVCTHCSEEPRRAVQVDPEPVRPVPKRRAAPAPITVDYPGGQVTCSRGVIRSVGMGKARGAGPRDALMARRAAYLVAVRNAGLFMAGLRVDDEGRTRDDGRRMKVADVKVSDFREVDSSFDPNTRTAKVTIEIRSAK